ncbi:MAG: hypothetical protein GXP63_07540 [DPANN group archaeon]|nr:hypothetical protein [DPANN group archaeon]
MNTQNIYRIFVFSLMLLASIAMVNGLSASIGNARMVLQTQVASDKMVFVERSIKVININNVSVNVHLTPLGNLTGITQILDNDILLQPGESKDARFKVQILEPGFYEGLIAVGFSEVGPDARAGGVGLQSNIIINAQLNESAPGFDKPATPPPTEDGNEGPADGSGTASAGNSSGAATSETAPVPSTATVQKTGGPDTLIGILIIIVILAIGIVGYLVFTKRLR